MNTQQSSSDQKTLYKGNLPGGQSISSLLSAQSGTPLHIQSLGIHVGTPLAQVKRVSGGQAVKQEMVTHMILHIDFVLGEY